MVSLGTVATLSEPWIFIDDPEAQRRVAAVGPVGGERRGCRRRDLSDVGRRQHPIRFAGCIG
jgi:hypothetical protein